MSNALNQIRVSHNPPAQASRQRNTIGRSVFAQGSYLPQASKHLNPKASKLSVAPAGGESKRAQ